MESGKYVANVRAKETCLDKRKAALLWFNCRHGIVLDMNLGVSKGANALVRFYVVHWRSRVAAHLEVRKVLGSLAISSRRSIYARA